MRWKSNHNFYDSQSHKKWDPDPLDRFNAVIIGAYRSWVYAYLFCSFSEELIGESIENFIDWFDTKRTDTQRLHASIQCDKIQNSHGFTEREFQA